MAINTNEGVVYRGINYWVAMILGWVFVVVGIWGFFQDPILGIFEVGLIHNLVHLLSGAVLLAAAYINGGEYARTTNLTLGIVYALVTLLGFITPAFLNSIIDFGYPEYASVWLIPDNYLHLLLTIALLGAAFAEREPTVRPTAGAIR